jgi:hypothetical protein
MEEGPKFKECQVVLVTGRTLRFEMPEQVKNKTKNKKKNKKKERI